MVSDAFIAVPWALVNGFLGWVAWRWARWLHPFDPPLPRVGHALLLAWAAVTACGLALGALGALTGVSYLALVFAVSLAGCFLLPRPWPRHYPFHLDLSSWARVWLVVAAVMLGHAIVRGICSFPSVWDTLGYHLPLVDSWIQAHSLYAPDNSHWSVPGNLELLGLWFVAPFSGDFWIGLTNVPVTLLLALATYQFARAVGLEARWAHLATLAVMGNAIVWGQLMSLENDVALAALFTAALLYAVRYARQGYAGDLLSGGLAAGLLAGVKLYAPGYVAVALLGALAFARVHRRSVRPVLLTWGMLVLVLGSYWYVRNAVLTGSPVYPMMLSGQQVVVEEGRTSAWTSSFLGCGRIAVAWYGLRAGLLVGGPCIVAALVLFPAAALMLACRVKERRGETRALVLVGLAAWGMFAITPGAVEAIPGTMDQLIWEPRTAVRYGLCWEMMAIVAVALVVQRAALLHSWPRWPWWISIAAVASQYLLVVANPARGMTAEVTAGMEVVFPDTFLAATNVLLMLWISRIAWSDYRPMLCGSIIVLSLGSAALSQWWHEEFIRHYDALFKDRAIATLDASTADGSKICVMDARPYPFFGPRRQLRVCQPVRLQSGRDLLAFLDAHSVDVLIVRSDTNPFPETIPEHTRAMEVLAASRLKVLRRGLAFSVYQVTTSSDVP